MANMHPISSIEVKNGQSVNPSWRAIAEILIHNQGKTASTFVITCNEQQYELIGSISVMGIMFYPDPKSAVIHSWLIDQEGQLYLALAGS